MKTGRISEVDIVKALAIILMVAGHSGVPFVSFIYLFHMAAFFIASGFVFKSDSSSSLKNTGRFIITKIKQLWIPYFIWNTIFTLLNNVFLKVNIYTDNPEIYNYMSTANEGVHQYMTFGEMLKNILKGALFGGGTQMGGATWFLKTLFFVSVAYCIADLLIGLIFKKNRLLIQAIISAVLLAFGYWCSLGHVDSLIIKQTASYYCLFFLGRLLFLFREKYMNRTWKLYLPVLLVSFGLLLILNHFGSVALNACEYKNPAFLLIASVSGWCFLYSISFFVARTKIKGFFTFIGKRTLTILILHFLSMKTVALVVIAVYALPAFSLAAYPHLYGDRGLWWLCYTVIGVAIPILVNIPYRKLSDKIKNSLKSKKAC